MKTRAPAVDALAIRVVRYELFSPVLNHQNQVANFTPANGGGLIHTPSNCSGWSSCALIDTNKNDFGQKIQITESTVLDISYPGNFARRMLRLRNANRAVIGGVVTNGNPILAFPYSNLNSGTNPETGPLINYTAFALPARGTFGNCAPRSFAGPPLQNVDLSLFKGFMFRESMKVEFRAEAFNALNHPNFANPKSAYSASTGGVFGRVTATLPNTTPRDMQLALKLYF